LRHHNGRRYPMEELKKALADRELSEWARWVINSSHHGARETLLFLERAFCHLPTRAQKRVRKQHNIDSNKVDSRLHELMLYEVCLEFGLNPDFEPEMKGQTPDLTLKIANQTFVADVFLTNRPTTTLRGCSGYRDSGEAAKKIADVVSKKAHRYRELRFPLILFVVFAGRDVGTHDLETALFGATVNELSLTGGLTSNCHEDWHCHGALCPPGPTANHRELSAVIACDWFDTLASTKPGRRLHCVVYHHWQPYVPLECGSFGRFQDVHWLNESGMFVPSISGEPNLVMSTTSRIEPEWQVYSASNPW
jgi:hypothetical protein